MLLQCLLAMELLDFPLSLLQGVLQGFFAMLKQSELCTHKHCSQSYLCKTGGSYIFSVDTYIFPLYM